MGRRIYWNELIREANFTESFCRSLLPSNPPSLSCLNETKSFIERELARAVRLPENEDGYDWSDGRYKSAMESELRLREFETIIVGKNHIPGMNIPIVYKIDIEGDREEIQADDRSNPLNFAIVIQDKRFEKNMTVLVGYILLYLSYPLRMHRMMKAYQIQEIAHLLSQREKAYRDKFTLKNEECTRSTEGPKKRLVTFEEMLSMVE